MYSYLLAERYAHLGEREPALEWLGIAIENGFWNAAFMRSDPLLDKLRGDPELTRLIELAHDKTKQFGSE